MKWRYESIWFLTRQLGWLRIFWFLTTEFRWTAFRIIYHLTLVVYLTCLTILPLTILSLNILNHYMLSKTKLELLKRTLLNSIAHLTGFKLEWFFLNFLLFGTIKWRSGTPSDKLVLRILRQDWAMRLSGISNESCALQAYQFNQTEIVHSKLVVCKARFIINPL